MYVNSLTNFENKNVSVIGEVEKIEEEIVFLSVGKNEVMVKHNGLDSYKTKYVRIRGVVENGMLIEHVVCPIPEDFDMELYEKFVNLNCKFAEIF